VFWRLRYTVLAAMALCLSVTALVSFVLSRTISRPIRRDLGRHPPLRAAKPRLFSTSRLSPAG
jgi:hypothetical protein